MTDREVMQMALDAMVSFSTGTNGLYEGEFAEEIAALCTALAQPEQEPVAWRTFDGEGGYEYRDYDMNESYAEEWAKQNPNHANWVEPLFLKD